MVIDMPSQPLMQADAGEFRFYLWHVEDGATESIGAFRIMDGRCPRAHAHVVYSGRDEATAVSVLRTLAANPPPFLPCDATVKAWEPETYEIACDCATHAPRVRTAQLWSDEVPTVGARCPLSSFWAPGKIVRVTPLATCPVCRRKGFQRCPNCGHAL